MSQVIFIKHPIMSIKQNVFKYGLIYALFAVSSGCAQLSTYHAPQYYERNVDIQQTNLQQKHWVKMLPLKPKALRKDSEDYPHWYD